MVLQSYSMLMNSTSSLSQTVSSSSKKMSPFISLINNALWSIHHLPLPQVFWQLKQKTVHYNTIWNILLLILIIPSGIDEFLPPFSGCLSLQLLPPSRLGGGPSPTTYMLWHVLSHKFVSSLPSLKYDIEFWQWFKDCFNT